MAKLRNKTFADRFISLHYKELSNKFKKMDNKINNKGATSLDKLNDTCLSLYSYDTNFKTYRSFEQMAHKKFNNSIKGISKK